MTQHTILIILAVISLIFVIILVFELGYVIYMMQNNDDVVSSLYKKNHRHHSRLEEHFNPERNYPQPANSILKEQPVDLYYAAGNTETLNDYEHLRDNYYVRNVEQHN